ANKSYKKQVKTYAKQLSASPVAGDSGLMLATDWVGTTNFNMRKPNFVIIHHTAQNSCEETLKTFTMTRTQVSAHYVICKDGIIHHMLNDYLRAWHGGVAKWGNNTDINSSSIGIEIDNNNETVPKDFNNVQASRIIRYDIKDSAAAIEAFKRKYLQQDKSNVLNEADKKVLFTLYRKYE